MFKKILVPLDGSEHSSSALEIAAQIAKKFQAQLTLLHVYSFVAPVMMAESFTQTTSGLPIIRPSLTSADLAEMEKEARQVGERILIEAKEKLASEGIIVDSSLTEGNPVQEITRIAKEGTFDLIVMGIRGIGKLKELLVGSVSDGVIKQSSCPVLIVK